MMAVAHGGEDVEIDQALPVRWVGVEEQRAVGIGPGVGDQQADFAIPCGVGDPGGGIGDGQIDRRSDAFDALSANLSG